MMDIERFIYEFNLVSTGTVKDRYEWANIVNNNIDMKVNYKNCISLYHLVDSYNKLYLRFRKDEIEYPKIDMDGDIKFGWYDGDKKSKYERFTMIINDSYILYLERIDDKYRCYYVCGDVSLNEDCEENKLLLNDEDIKKYLEIGSKYDVLIDGYNYFKDRQIFCNGTSMMFTRIKGNLFNGCDSFEISFGNASMNCEDYINIVFRLGDKLEIDYDNSLVILEGLHIEDKSNIIDEFVKGIYVNKDMIYSSNDVDNNVNMNVKRMLPNS